MPLLALWGFIHINILYIFAKCVKNEKFLTIILFHGVDFIDFPLVWTELLKKYESLRNFKKWNCFLGWAVSLAFDYDT
jgi:hypothetical protein